MLILIIILYFLQILLPTAELCTGPGPLQFLDVPTGVAVSTWSFGRSDPQRTEQRQNHDAISRAAAKVQPPLQHEEQQQEAEVARDDALERVHITTAET